MISVVRLVQCPTAGGLTGPQTATADWNHRGHIHREVAKHENITFEEAKYHKGVQKYWIKIAHLPMSVLVQLRFCSLRLSTLKMFVPPFVPTF